MFLDQKVLFPRTRLMTERIDPVCESLFAPQRPDLSGTAFPKMPCRMMYTCHAHSLLAEVWRTVFWLGYAHDALYAYLCHSWGFHRLM